MADTDACMTPVEDHIRALADDLRIPGVRLQIDGMDLCWSRHIGTPEVLHAIADRLSHEAGTQEPVAWPEIRRIEMVKLVEYWTEPAEPMWRFEVGGICADFETETGANNFRSAIIRYAGAPLPADDGAEL